MKNYQYNHWDIYRKEKKIIIKNLLNGKIFETDILPKHNILGKINIPLSNLCTMNCLYCSEAEMNTKNPMVTSFEIGTSIIDAYFDFIRNKNDIEIVCLSFDYGGEPMCAFSALIQLSHYFRNQCAAYHKHSIIQMTTNGVWDTNLVDDVLMVVDEIIFSIDGNKEIHDKYRKYKNEESCFNLIVENAKKVYSAGKLKQISSVITLDTISNYTDYAKFFMENFSGTSIKVHAVMITGNAKLNELKKILLEIWSQFIIQIKQIVGDSITILNSKPDKDVFYAYFFGCEHMCMTNWFYWLNGTITCCTDRDYEPYIIGKVEKNIVNMNYERMHLLQNNNYIENITKCNDCLAKYYCSGGCSKFDNINCKRRIHKYAKLLIEKARL